MFYFIPSWYNPSRQWYDDTPTWSRVYDKMEFDDTINQLKMFQQAQEKCALLVLSYRPQLRYFLHKQDLQATAYWSFFDDIQNISRTHTKKIDFKRLNWGEGVSFLYSPFIVLVRKEGKTIASVYFAENGNVLTIDKEKDGVITESYVFDDRGFLSSYIAYKKGEAIYQDYLNENGVWQVREYLHQDGFIAINPEADKLFSKTLYQSWEELLRERLELFSSCQMTETDTLIIASDPRHNAFLTSVFLSYSKVFSFFGDRCSLSDTAQLTAVSEAADLIVTEKKETHDALINSLKLSTLPEGKRPSVLVSTPFDTRLRLGHSQSQKELEIYFFIDTINLEKRQRVLKRLLALMERSDAIKLIIASYDRALDANALKKDINQLIDEAFDSARFFSSVKDSGENQIDVSEEEDNDRVSVELITSETQIIGLLDHVRLVIDLGEKPDLYTQIASISAGIPQINHVQTEYVSHQKNGWIARTEEELEKAVHYYFNGLRHWNDSLVYAVEKMGAYTSGQLLARWKEALEMKREYE